MAGSILGQDQINKLNQAYPVLLTHIRELLTSDRSAHGLMKVHVLTEYLDTTELAKIFSGLSFISPAEKRALVRAAIYEVLITDKNQLVAEPVALVISDNQNTSSSGGAVELKTFTPPAFKLNVATADSIKTELY